MTLPELLAQGRATAYLSAVMSESEYAEALARFAALGMDVRNMVVAPRWTPEQIIDLQLRSDNTTVMFIANDKTLIGYAFGNPKGTGVLLARYPVNADMRQCTYHVEGDECADHMSADNDDNDDYDDPYCEWCENGTTWCTTHSVYHT